MHDTMTYAKYLHETRKKPIEKKTLKENITTVHYAEIGLKFNFTSALHNVKNNSAIVDHLFAEVLIVLSLFMCTNES